MENIDTSGSLISHLTSNRTLCPPIDGKEDRQEKPHQVCLKHSSKIRVRMQRKRRRSVLKYYCIHHQRFLPPHVLPPIKRTTFNHSRLWEALPPSDTAPGSALEVPSRGWGSSERKSPVYFHITALGSVHLKAEKLGEGKMRGLLLQTDSGGGKM